MRIWRMALLGLLLAGPAAAAPDPFAWLDDSNTALTKAWVARENRATLAALSSDARFKALEAEAATVLNNPSRLEPVQFIGDGVFQYHQSREAPLGVWRRASRASWFAGTPDWQTIIDLDRLAAQDKRKWFFAGASCRAQRCLVRLSENGKDAVETREFDLASRSFVANGFFVPNSKSRTWWVDDDRLLVAPVLGPESLNRSELPKTLRLWRRGTPLEQARPLFAIDDEDAMLSAMLIDSNGRQGFVAARHTDFERKLYEWVGLDGSRRALPLPEYAGVMGVAGGDLLLRINTDWQPAGGAITLPQGALVAVPMAALLDRADVSGARLLYRPDGNDALRGVTVADGTLYLELLHDYRSKIVALTADGATRPLPLPADRFITPLGVERGRLLLQIEAPLVPPSLVLADPANGTLQTLASAAPAFRADDLVSELRRTTSRDGTPITYTITYQRGLKADGRQPTLIYGYGGYDVPVTPRYEPVFGKLWLERGGVYVHAYLRGGGEHGPAWHRGAMRKNRQQPYDDMAAVVAHLQATGIASPATTAIMGRSNGGLMTATVMEQIPTKLAGVVVGGPLIDMLNFHDLQPGGTWTAEYGDPRDPEMRPFLASYSPMQNIAPAAKQAYPVPLIITSKDDDRVLPGHARRFAANLRAAGHKPLYWEDDQGGHYWELAGGPAPGDWRLRSRARAIEFAYLWQKLAPQR
jgi:prolyl oligopeptidase